MKYLSLAFLVGILSFSNLSIAQEYGSSEMTYKKGIRAGWHYAGMYRSGDQIYSNLNSFYVGFFNEAQASDVLWVGSGFEYFQNGFENSSGNFKMHTISLPFYLKPKVGPVYGSAGFSLNFKLGDNREDFPSQIVDTKFFDLPLHLGLGVELGPVMIEAKYYWGLFNAATVDGSGQKNQYLQAGLGFSF